MLARCHQVAAAMRPAVERLAYYAAPVSVPILYNALAALQMDRLARVGDLRIFLTRIESARPQTPYIAGDTQAVVNNEYLLRSLVPAIGLPAEDATFVTLATAQRIAGQLLIMPLRTA